LKQKSPIHLDVSNWGAAIFDMDGVVVDTVPIHFRAWKKMAEDYARAFTFEDYKAKVDGIPRIDGARAILEGMDEETVLAASDKKQHYFLELLGKEEIPTYPSTLDLITELRRLQIRVAVISSSKNAPLILERIGLAHDIDALISGGDIQRGKPDPDIFLQAARRLGITPENCIVFEDAVLGVEAAKRAGMFCVGIDRYQAPGRLAKADIVISDVAEVSVDHLRRWFTRT
jgi:beta-phosphoglucomutase